MRPIHFTEANRIYNKPQSMTDEECYPVSAYEHYGQDGKIESIATVWQPNKEDIDAIVAGRPIILKFTAPFLVAHVLLTYDENGNINE